MMLLTEALRGYTVSAHQLFNDDVLVAPIRIFLVACLTILSSLTETVDRFKTLLFYLETL